MEYETSAYSTILTIIMIIVAILVIFKEDY